jgi:hypothetical protein
VTFLVRNDLRIDQLRFDFAVSLVMTSSDAEQLVLRIACPYRLREEGVSCVVLNPEDDPVLQAALLRYCRDVMVTTMEVSEGGGISITLEGGITIDVAPHSDYEAWELGSSRGIRIVSLPGGGLATF